MIKMAVAFASYANMLNGSVIIIGYVHKES